MCSDPEDHAIFSKDAKRLFLRFPFCMVYVVAGQRSRHQCFKFFSAENPLPLPLQTKSAHIAQAMGWCATVASRTGLVSERAYTGDPERHCHIISPSVVSIAENGSQTATGQKGDNQSKETKKVIFHTGSDSKITHEPYTIFVFSCRKKYRKSIEAFADKRMTTVSGS